MASQLQILAGTMADDATVGTIAWSNPDNAKVSDAIYTTVDTGTNATSHYLKATNFGFALPLGATINGILVEIQRKRGTTLDNVKDSGVKIVKSDGSLGTQNKADTVTVWPSAEAYASYGSSSDLWNETWGASDINNSNFGVVISAICVPDGTQPAQVDHIRITVYYTEGFSMTFV